MYLLIHLKRCITLTGDAGEMSPNGPSVTPLGGVVTPSGCSGRIPGAVWLRRQFEIPANKLCEHGNHRIEFALGRFRGIHPEVIAGRARAPLPVACDVDSVRVPFASAHDDPSRAAWSGSVGGTMVLVGRARGRAPARSGTDRGCVIRVAISLSVVLLLAIILVVLIRGGSLKAGPAVVAVLFGFFLASTGMADDIERFLDAVGDSISSIDI
jgi:hypothetical protein